LLSLADLDGRTRAAQAAEATKAAIIVDLGGEDTLSTLERIQAENAAMAAAVLRDMHVRWLRGDSVSVTEMATIENTFNRTAASLGTGRRAKEIASAIILEAKAETARRGQDT
jgi:hypothetical protein